jgi:hypothetical protein
MLCFSANSELIDHATNQSFIPHPPFRRSLDSALGIGLEFSNSKGYGANNNASQLLLRLSAAL